MSQMLMAIFIAYLNSGVTSGKICRRDLKMEAILKILKILNTASIWHQKWKDHPKLCKKKYFQGDDIIDDVTEWPQSHFSISLYEWKKNNIFRDNWRMNKDIIFKLSVHMYHWIVNTPLQMIVDCFVDDKLRVHM